MSLPYRLYLDDCLERLASIPEDTFDLIFADPPYNLSNDGFTCKGGRMVSVNKGNWDRSEGFENDYNFHYSWLAACQRVLKPNGTIWVSGTYHSIFSCGHAMQSLGYHILNDISWFKPNASPNLSRRFFTASHETLIWSKKNKQAIHTFHYEAMRQGDFSHDRLKAEGKQMRSVWAIAYTPASEKQHGYHPTQKPIKLLERVVLSSSNEGDLVLDPFCGSGTTGLVAIANGRRFVGIDREAEYIELTRKRLSHFLSHQMPKKAE